MLKTALSASLALFCCTPASATVVYHDQGTAIDVLNVFAVLPDIAGIYHFILDAPGLADIPQRFGYYERGYVEDWYDHFVFDYYRSENGMDGGDLTFGWIDGLLVAPPVIRPSQIDKRDATGTGYVFRYLGSNTYTYGSFLYYIPAGHAPVNWSLDVVLDSIPEPATWALMIAGFGAAGVSLRRARSGSPRAMPI